MNPIRCSDINMRVLLLGVVIFCLAENLNAQQIEGYILDAKTKEPIPYVNVYFANTTIGTATDQKGYFLISNFIPGKYDLTVSFVGYNIYSKPIEIEMDESLSLKISLKEKLVELPELFVLADTSNWEDNFQIFRKNFIGLTEASGSCEIKNRKSLVFYFDPNSKVLYAHAREPLVIENKWLGYQIIYDLQSFNVNLKEGRLAYYGVPRFSSLSTDKKRQEKRWLKRREQCYDGSILHFYRSLHEEKLKEKGFDVYVMHRIPNPERPSESFINNTLSSIKEKIKSKYKGNKFTITSVGSEPKTLTDSLVYFNRLKRLPQFKDSVGRNVENGAELIDESGKVNFSGRLLVIYKDNVPDNYPQKRDKDYEEKQTTTLHVINPIRVYNNGYYESVKDAFVQGYWSWTGNLATLLPLDYYPEN